MRFIDGHAVMERLQKQTEVITNNLVVAGLLSAQVIVLETPTIDAVEVVRCKDCRWNEMCCINIRTEGRRSDDYCSCGERREEGEG